MMLKDKEVKHNILIKMQIKSNKGAIYCHNYCNEKPLVVLSHSNNTIESITHGTEIIKK